MDDNIKETEHRIALLFDESPISLWDEDFTEVKVYLDILKNKGVTDFRKFFDENPDELAICSRKVMILDVNKAALKLHGAKNKDDLFGNIYKIFTKESLKVFKEELIVLAVDGTQYESEAVVKTLNGEEINIFIKFSVMYSEETDKKVVRAFVAATDITKRMDVNNALRESESKFRNLAENTSVAILMYQNDYWVYANSFAIKTTGYTNEELMKMKFWEFVHPDYQQKIINLGKKRQENKEADNSYEFKVLTKNNDVKWVWLSGTSCMHNGKPAGLISVMDITKRKLAEEELLKLSTAVKQSPNMVILTDLSGNIIYTNPKFTKITGYDLKEAIGVNPSILKSGEMKDEFYTNLWETISSGEIWKGEMSNKKIDGTIYWEKAIISPVLDNDKKIINYLKIGEDITDKKRMEYELEQHREHLEELVAQRTQELEEKNIELERSNKLFINREHRIKELRDELKKYKK